MEFPGKSEIFLVNLVVMLIAVNRVKGIKIIPKNG